MPFNISPKWWTGTWRRIRLVTKSIPLKFCVPHFRWQNGNCCHSRSADVEAWCQIFWNTFYLLSPWSVKLASSDCGRGKQPLTFGPQRSTRFPLHLHSFQAQWSYQCFTCLNLLCWLQALRLCFMNKPHLLTSLHMDAWDDHFCTIIKCVLVLNNNANKYKIQFSQTSVSDECLTNQNIRVHHKLMQEFHKTRSKDLQASVSAHESTIRETLWKNGENILKADETKTELVGKFKSRYIRHKTNSAFHRTCQTWWWWCDGPGLLCCFRTWMTCRKWWKQEFSRLWGNLIWPNDPRSCDTVRHLSVFPQVMRISTILLLFWSDFSDLILDLVLNMK